VAAQAEDLHFVPDALAMVATVLLLFLGKASTGRIRAFLWIRHNSPLPIRSASFWPRHAEMRCRERRKMNSENVCEETSKTDQDILEFQI
jgi:hypothetical protein